MTLATIHVGSERKRVLSETQGTHRTFLKNDVEFTLWNHPREIRTKEDAQHITQSGLQETENEMLKIIIKALLIF
jgi:hypothetical protein